jgi:hypothetical protein
MTLKICVLGNSHVGSFKLGWDAVKSAHKNVQLDFFASPGASLAEIEIIDGRVVTESAKVLRSFQKTGGADSFKLADYDAFVLVGLRSGFKWAVRNFRKLRPTMIAEEGDQVISNALFGEMLRMFFAETPQSRVLEIIRTHVKVPIFCLPDPLISRDVVDSEDGAFYKRIIGHNAGEVFGAIYRREYDRCFASRAKVLFQPEETIVDGFFSEPRFSAGSVRLASMTREHDESDHDHMNADFGRLIVNAMLREVAPALT